jgi:hypothetical protein
VTVDTFGRRARAEEFHSGDLDEPLARNDQKLNPESELWVAGKDFEDEPTATPIRLVLIDQRLGVRR